MILNTNLKRNEDMPDEIFRRILKVINKNEPLYKQSVVDRNKATSHHVDYYFEEIGYSGYGGDNEFFKHDDDNVCFCNETRYQIVNYDNDYNVTKRYNAFVTQTICRTGSYYKGYHYNYSEIESYRVEPGYGPKAVRFDVNN